MNSNIQCVRKKTERYESQKRHHHIHIIIQCPWEFIIDIKIKSENEISHVDGLLQS